MYWIRASHSNPISRLANVNRNFEGFLVLQPGVNSGKWYERSMVCVAIWASSTMLFGSHMPWHIRCWVLLVLLVLLWFLFVILHCVSLLLLLWLLLCLLCLLLWIILSPYCERMWRPLSVWLVVPVIVCPEIVQNWVLKLQHLGKFPLCMRKPGSGQLKTTAVVANCLSHTDRLSLTWTAEHKQQPQQLNKGQAASVCLAFIG